MKRFQSIAAAILIAALGAPCGAGAQEMMALRTEATVSGDIVRLGDLVERAGPNAQTPLFRSPALGSIGTIRAERIAEAARELGLASIDTRGVPAVTIHRPSREASREEISSVLQQALKAHDSGAADAHLALDPLPQPLVLERDGNARINAEILFFDAQLERFEARVSADRPGASIRVTGGLELSIAVTTLARPIARGETIQAADLTTERRKRRAIPTGALIEPTSLTGLVARRALRAGDVVKEGDVVRPNLVEKNQLVTVQYERPGLSLTLRGKALGQGVEGAVIPVLNLQSKRTIDTVIVGPGRVSARMDGASPATP